MMWWGGGLLGHEVARGEEENGGGGEEKGEIVILGRVGGSCGNLSSRRLVFCRRDFRRVGSQLGGGLWAAIGEG